MVIKCDELPPPPLDDRYTPGITGFMTDWKTGTKMRAPLDFLVDI